MTLSQKVRVASELPAVIMQSQLKSLTLGMCYSNPGDRDYFVLGLLVLQKDF
jgi:hypothetical protein